MRKAIIVGLTGQTGAGKTTVAEFLKKYGYAVIEADKIAALVTEKGSPELKKLAKAFGEDILNCDGSLRRDVLAERAFMSPDRTRVLDEITHPAIIHLMMKKVNGEFFNGYEAVILDAPQLFESGLNTKCNMIVSVTAPEDIRLQRILKRDDMSEEKAKLRMSAQHTEEFFRNNSDFVVENDGDDERLKEQILFLVRLMESKISGEAE